MQSANTNSIYVQMGSEFTTHLAAGEEKEFYTDSLRGCLSCAVVSQYQDHSKTVTFAHYSEFNMQDGYAEKLKENLEKNHDRSQDSHHTLLLVIPVDYVKNETSNKIDKMEVHPLNPGYAASLGSVVEKVFSKNLSGKSMLYRMSNQAGLDIAPGDPLLESEVLKSKFEGVEFNGVGVYCNQENNLTFICNNMGEQVHKFSVQKDEINEDYTVIQRRFRQNDRREFSLHFFPDNSIYYSVFGNHVGFLEQASAEHKIAEPETASNELQPSRTDFKTDTLGRHARSLLPSSSRNVPSGKPGPSRQAPDVSGMETPLRTRSKSSSSRSRRTTD